MCGICGMTQGLRTTDLEVSSNASGSQGLQVLDQGSGLCLVWSSDGLPFLNRAPTLVCCCPRHCLFIDCKGHVTSYLKRCKFLFTLDNSLGRGVLTPRTIVSQLLRASGSSSYNKKLPLCTELDDLTHPSSVYPSRSFFWK